MAFFTDRNSKQCLTPDRIGVWAQFGEVSSRFRPIDILIFAFILGFGAMQFLLCVPTGDFSGDDVFWADAARSLIQHGFYGINGYPETNQPPGLAAVLAVLCFVGACSHVVFLRAMVVFATLGFLVTYELLRRQAPRAVAAAICLLLISSGIHFDLVTRSVEPCDPYFLTAMSALLVARKLDESTHSTLRFGWGVLLAALVSASLMFASAAIAFLGAIAANIGLAFLRFRRLSFSGLKVYVAVLFVGIAVEGLWMHQNRVEASAGIAASEWPLPGFPHSYLAQLKLKSGNYPELGRAKLRDIPSRILQNAGDYSYFLNQAFLRLSPNAAWASVLILAPLLLIALGWCYSVWTPGTDLQAWYFAGYCAIYLFWPWMPVPRFFMPVAPLAGLYIWRGGMALVLLAKSKPRLLGAVWFPVAMFLGASALLWMHEAGKVSRMAHAAFSCIAWLLSAILALWLLWAHTAWLTQASFIWRRFLGKLEVLQVNPQRILRLLGIVVVVSLILMGLRMQLGIARTNLNAAANHSADEEAAAWISSHTDSDSIIMARHVPTAYHYSKRKVVWFPASTNPKLLMEGILNQKVAFVIVVRRDDSYYLPSDDDCFAPLLAAYPDTFDLMYETAEFRIYQVVKKVDSRPGHVVGSVG
jgi:hypothetical protein